jgi:hypothetical protein
MKQEKKLKVTAKYGSLEYSETASPYNKKTQEEQVETCVKSIRRQIADVGKAEMMDAFQQTSELIE